MSNKIGFKTDLFLLVSCHVNGEIVEI
jgi:hypothetical protein